MTPPDRKPASPVAERPRRNCPLCGRQSSADAFPFCSKRCADVDLNRWLVGAYAIPAVDPEEEDEQNTEG